LDFGPAGNNWALDATDTLIKSGLMEAGVSISNTTIPSYTFIFNSRGLPAGTPGAYDVTLTNLEGSTKQVHTHFAGRVNIE